MTQPYPRRLYLHGEVIDAEASNSVVVADVAAEEEARANGYRNAWYWLPKFGGASPHLQENQGEAAIASVGLAGDTYTAADESEGTIEASAGIAEALRAECIAAGLKPHHKAGETKLRAMLAEAKAAA